MTDKFPNLVHSSSLSYAWSKVLALTMAPSAEEIPHLVVSIEPTSGTPVEDPKVTAILDKHLQFGTSKRRQSSATVAKTIFPYPLDRPGGSLQELVARYLRIFPQLQTCRANKRGTYFQRMIAFQPAGSKEEPVNQLEKVIEDLKAPSTRRSGLQLGIFDPTRDHLNTPYLGFPCLQQIAITTHADDAISLVAIYPLHFVYERAYGNYLGLIHLGNYIARMSGRKLRAVTCVSATAQREVQKGAVQGLHDELETYVSSLGGYAALNVRHLS